MTTHRIEIRTPALPLPTLTMPTLTMPTVTMPTVTMPRVARPAMRLRRLRAVLVLQLSSGEPGVVDRRPHERALAAATDRLEQHRSAAHAARLGAL
ncbi:hypothetical protein ICW40_05515 [Actinotalea ferrariae]|uniref:hypothetical protein n=1 Tax=Actinotalea ferrariae TaxID=1386098 RepID=UPI001C8C7120|nr:hypothetical protein [Actinotalea ferrariae]MBX9244264.1 hypothetical protein [Actinotalea ferrariae]